MDLPDIDIDSLPPEDVAALLGRLVERVVLAAMRQGDKATPSLEPQEGRILSADEGAAIAGTSRRWIVTATRGKSFRRDLSRKQARFDEAGLRRWLAGRGR